MKSHNMLALFANVMAVIFLGIGMIMIWVPDIVDEKTLLKLMMTFGLLFAISFFANFMANINAQNNKENSPDKE